MVDHAVIVTKGLKMFAAAKKTTVTVPAPLAVPLAAPLAAPLPVPLTVPLAAVPALKPLVVEAFLDISGSTGGKYGKGDNQPTIWASICESAATLAMLLPPGSNMSVHAFNHDVKKITVVTPETVAAMEDLLKRHMPGGATDLLNVAMHTASSRADLCVVFTDGGHTDAKGNGTDPRMLQESFNAIYAGKTAPPVHVFTFGPGSVGAIAKMMSEGGGPGGISVYVHQGDLVQQTVLMWMAHVLAPGNKTPEPAKNSPGLQVFDKVVNILADDLTKRDSPNRVGAHREALQTAVGVVAELSEAAPGILETLKDLLEGVSLADVQDWYCNNIFAFQSCLKNAFRSSYTGLQNKALNVFADPASDTLYGRICQKFNAEQEARRKAAIAEMERVEREKEAAQKAADAAITPEARRAAIAQKAELEARYRLQISSQRATYVSTSAGCIAAGTVDVLENIDALDNRDTQKRVWVQKDVGSVLPGDTVRLPSVTVTDATVMTVTDVTVMTVTDEPMVKLPGGLIISEWHPITDLNGGAAVDYFPCEHPAAQKVVYTGPIHNFAVSHGYKLSVSGYEVATLGASNAHTSEKPYYHMFLGCPAVIENIRMLPQDAAGRRVITGALRDSSDGHTIVSFI